MLEGGLADAVVSAISNTNPADIVSIPIVRTVGNIASGPAEWINPLLSNDGPSMLLLALHILLSMDSAHKSVIKESLWALGNILGRSGLARVKALEASLLTRVFELIQTDQVDIQRESVYALHNACVQSEVLALVFSQGGPPVVAQLV
jgi:hypothetical protein